MYRWAFSALAVLCFAVNAQSIPDNAYRYKRSVIAEAQYVFGLDAPVSMLAGQIHQESTWRPDVCSPYACGLSQFTDDTRDYVNNKFPELDDGDVMNPKWAIKAQALYMGDLKRRISAIDECNDYGFSLAAYNGGAGWIFREKNLVEQQGGNRDQYWNSVEDVSARADWAKEENRHYPRKIIFSLQYLYKDDGWGGVEVCGDRAVDQESDSIVFKEKIVEQTQPPQDDEPEKPAPSEPSDSIPDKKKAPWWQFWKHW